MTLLLPLLVQCVAFWAGVIGLSNAGVAPVAWSVLYGSMVAAFVVLARTAFPIGSARRWLTVLFYSVFFAVLFYFAEVGLDLLHGPARPKARVAEFLGGLEFWFFLCPGVSAFALAGLTRALLTTRWRRARA